MTNDKKLNLASIANCLANHHPEIVSPDNRNHAAVSMILKAGSSSPEVLFIIRAKHDRDPWSGNIAFPGGRLNQKSESPQQAAEREGDCGAGCGGAHPAVRHRRPKRHAALAGHG